VRKRTGHTTNTNHPRRRDIPGLTPSDLIAAMEKEAKHGKPLRKMRDKISLKKRSVLPDPRPPASSTPRSGGVPSAAEGDDVVGGASTQREAVPHNQRSEAGPGSQLSKVLKRMLGERVPVELLSIQGVTQLMTNAEALASIVMAQALAGKQWAVEMIRDQSEGKPVRAAQENNHAASETETFLDRIGVARLNELTKGK
jgi:hypothetical protein